MFELGSYCWIWQSLVLAAIAPLPPWCACEPSLHSRPTLKIYTSQQHWCSGMFRWPRWPKQVYSLVMVPAVDSAVGIPETRTFQSKNFRLHRYWLWQTWEAESSWILTNICRCWASVCNHLLHRAWLWMMSLLKYRIGCYLIPCSQDNATFENLDCQWQIVSNSY